MSTIEHIEVECLTDESGTAYAVSFYVGKHKVYSKWTRLASAEKLASTLRAAFQPEMSQGNVRSDIDGAEVKAEA